jgi:hypothetical protein
LCKNYGKIWDIHTGNGKKSTSGAKKTKTFEVLNMDHRKTIKKPQWFCYFLDILLKKVKKVIETNKQNFNTCNIIKYSTVFFKDIFAPIFEV